MPAVGDRVPSVEAKSAQRDANVLRWLVAYTASVIGDSGYFLALGWAASQIVGAAQVGVVMAVGAVPRAVLMLGGGVVADRFGPRRVVIASDAVRCLVILLGAAVLAALSPGLWLLIPVALIFGAVDALFLPAVGTLPSVITDPGQLVRVQGMRVLAMRLGNTAGPPLAGMIMAFSSPSAAFAFSGGLFALSLVLLLTRTGSLPAAAEAAPAPLRGLTEGLRYVRHHQLIRSLVVSSALVELGCIAPLSVGLVLLAKERDWGASGAGAVVSAFSIGAGAGALLLTARGNARRAGLIQNITMTAAAAGIAVLAFIPTLPLAVAFAAVVGLGAGICGVLVYALVQTACEPVYLGRVTAVMSLASFGLGPLTYSVFGITVAVLGAGPAFLTFGVISGLGALVGWSSPAVRRSRLPR